MFGWSSAALSSYQGRRRQFCEKARAPSGVSPPSYRTEPRQWSGASLLWEGWGQTDTGVATFQQVVFIYLFKSLEEHILTKWNYPCIKYIIKSTNRLSELTGTMQSYEAIRWALDRLNKKNTVLNGEFLTDSYVPGVKLGKLHFT